MAKGLRGNVSRQLVWLSGLLVRGDTLKLTPGGPALVHYGVIVAMGTEAVASKLAGRQEESNADSSDKAFDRIVFSPKAATIRVETEYE